MEVPPLPDGFFGDDSREARTLGTADYLRRGLIWLLVGLGVAIALAINKSPESATWALIPVAFLIGQSGLPEQSTLRTRHQS